MSGFDLLVIAPAEYVPADSEQESFDTPYGLVQIQRHALDTLQSAWIAPGTSPFAALYAAKAAGASRVVELARVAARNRLLAIGDLLLPADLVDRTRLARYTFFVGKGYGFLSQREPFCPVLRGALLAAAVERFGSDADQPSPHVFARGIYLAADQPVAADAELIWNADIVGDGVVPISFLARELELCYAPLCVVVKQPATLADFTPAAVGAGSRLPVADMLADTLRHLPVERDCGCASAMQQYRDRGDIAADWRTWITI